MNQAVWNTDLKDFPGGSDGKESACNAGDLGSVLGLGRYPGEGNEIQIWIQIIWFQSLCPSSSLFILLSCLEFSFDSLLYFANICPKSLPVYSSLLSLILIHADQSLLSFSFMVAFIGLIVDRYVCPLLNLTYSL